MLFSTIATLINLPVIKEKAQALVTKHLDLLSSGELSLLTIAKFLDG